MPLRALIAAVWLAVLALAVAPSAADDGYEDRAADLLQRLGASAQVYVTVDIDAQRARSAARAAHCLTVAADPACAGYRLGTTAVAPSAYDPGRYGEIFKEYGLATTISAGVCTPQASRARIQPGTRRACIADREIDGTFAKVGYNVRSTIRHNISYLRLFQIAGGYFVSRIGDQTRRRVMVIFVDPDSVASFELIAANAAFVEKLRINNRDYHVDDQWGWGSCAWADAAQCEAGHQSAGRRPLCLFYDLDYCTRLTVAELDALPGLDMTDALEPGINSFSAYQTGSPPPGGGFLFRIRRREQTRREIPDLPACSSVLSDSCRLVAEPGSCLLSSGSQCLRMQRSYQCEEQLPALERVACGIEQVCPEGGCKPDEEDPGYAAEFAGMVAQLEMARQSATYFDRDSLRIFKGTTAQCRDKIAWGLGDCCKASATGGSSSNRQTLANLGISAAIRGVETAGSSYTHDALFLTSDLVDSLAGLGQGIAGLASSFTPALSYYGVEVAITQSGITFGFDPASFAIAVSLAVIANLLECDSGEQLLGLRVGAGLCQFQGSWCSKRRLFGCKEESEGYCCYNSKLARIVATQGGAQLGLPGNHCAGFSVEQFKRLDFSRIDLSEFIAEIAPADGEALLDRYRRDNMSGLDQALENRSAQVQVE